MILLPHLETETTLALLSQHRAAILAGTWNTAACAGALLYVHGGSARDAIISLPTHEVDPVVRRHYEAVRGYLRKAHGEQTAKLTERSARIEALLDVVHDRPSGARVVEHCFRVIRGGR